MMISELLKSGIKQTEQGGKYNQNNNILYQRVSTLRELYKLILHTNRQPNFYCAMCIKKNMNKGEGG